MLGTMQGGMLVLEDSLELEDKQLVLGMLAQGLEEDTVVVAVVVAVHMA